MSVNVELLEQSFEQIKPRASKFASSFYTTLFADYPSAQPLVAQTDIDMRCDRPANAGRC